VGLLVVAQKSAEEFCGNVRRVLVDDVAEPDEAFPRRAVEGDGDEFDVVVAVILLLLVHAPLVRRFDS
jgi:hypothetical protein